MPPQIYLPEDIADWEGRYRNLLERHELFLQKLCDELGLYYATCNENEVLEKLKSEIKITHGLLKGLSA